MMTETKVLDAAKAYEAGEYDKTYELAQACLDEDDQQAEAWHIQGVTHLKRNEYDLAFENI